MQLTISIQRMYNRQYLSFLFFFRPYAKRPNIIISILWTVAGESVFRVARWLRHSVWLACGEAATSSHAPFNYIPKLVVEF